MIERHDRHHLQELIAPVGHLLVPMFFVYTGMQVNLAYRLPDGEIIAVVALTIVAFASKLVAGLAAGDVRRWIVGWGMAPRGEVGLIFAATGKALGVIPDAVYSMVIVVVLLTTLLTPPVLVAVIRRAGVTNPGEAAAPAP